MQLTLTVREKRQETPTVTSLIFDKPEGIPHKAGQFFSWMFPCEKDERGNSRSFSIASSPTEDYILLTTRIGPSRVKQFIKNEAAGGTQVKVIGPLGRFILDDTDLPIAFIVGGVGITPLRSMIKYLIDTKSVRPITLIYSNPTPDEICFQKELDEWSSTHPSFTVVHTITRLDPGNTQWKGKTGRINEELVKEYVHDLNTTQFYTSGPPLMVKTIVDLLHTMQVPPELVHAESFSGY